MDLITPGIGLIFWTTLVFLILIFLLSKLAWKPILNAVKQREDNINNALESAEKAKEEMESLTAKNEELLKEAREERDVLLKEAREARDQMLADAKKKAQADADKIVSDARAAIETERAAAVAKLKNEVASISIEIAEKIIRTELYSESKQADLTNDLLKDIKLN